MLPPCGINLGRINALRSYWLDFVVLAAPQVENELNLRPGTTIEETGECLGIHVSSLLGHQRTMAGVEISSYTLPMYVHCFRHLYNLRNVRSEPRVSLIRYSLSFFI